MKVQVCRNAGKHGELARLQPSSSERTVLKGSSQAARPDQPLLRLARILKHARPSATVRPRRLGEDSRASQHQGRPRGHGAAQARAAGAASEGGEWTRILRGQTRDPQLFFDDFTHELARRAKGRATEAGASIARRIARRTAIVPYLSFLCVHAARHSHHVSVTAAPPPVVLLLLGLAGLLRVDLLGAAADVQRG